MPVTTLFVGNLPYSVTEQDLKDLFVRAGATVEQVRIVADLDTGRSKGYAFVEVPTPDLAQVAIAALNGTALEGRTISVDAARGGRGRRP